MARFLISAAALAPVALSGGVLPRSAPEAQGVSSRDLLAFVRRGRRFAEDIFGAAIRPRQTPAVGGPV